MRNIICPLCNEEIYSGLGEGCKMCGMALGGEENFCSLKCRNRYIIINEL